MESKKDLRLDLIKANHYDVERAKACYDFVENYGELGTAAPAPVPANTEKYPDGIYYVMKDGSYIRYEGQDEDINDCVGIGIKYGSRSLVVSYRDMGCQTDMTLTKCKDTTTGYKYVSDITDAVADWNGKANTEHLQAIGLNEQIKLEAGQWIPSLGELYFIFTNKRAINEALAHVVGADYIGDLWYWSSTEYSATGAWVLYLSNGGANGTTKAANQSRVRAVSAFLPL